MSGKFKDTDDDISFDDFDESLDDELWDDDEILDEDEAASEGDASDSGKKSKSKAEKKVKKSKGDAPAKKGSPVVMIAGLALALVAGVSVFALMGSAPNQQDSVISLEPPVADTAVLPLETQDTTTPPVADEEMPVGTETQADEQAALPPAGQVPPVSSDQDDVLTPLPQPDSLDQIELPPLLVDKIAEPAPMQESEDPAIEMPSTDANVVDDALPVPGDAPHDDVLPVPEDNTLIDSSLSEDKLLKETEKPFKEEMPQPDPQQPDAQGDEVLDADLESSLEHSDVSPVVPPAAAPVVAPAEKKADAPVKTELKETPKIAAEPKTSAEPLIDAAEEKAAPAPEVKTEKEAAPVAEAKPKAEPVNAAATEKNPDTIKQQPAVTATKTAEEQPETKPIKPAPVAWALRSAQTGSAVLLEKYSQEMRAVEVGDSLRGFGRITAIEKVNGKWRVVTTGGTISQ